MSGERSAATSGERGPAMRRERTRRRAARLGAGALVGALLAHSTLPVSLAEEGVFVSARVDAREIPLGETLSYTVEVRGAGMGGVAPGTPSGMTNLQLVGGPSTSTSFSFVNGAVSSSKSFTWFLTPQAAGKARIPALDVKVGSKIYKTEPLEIVVTPAGSGVRAPAQPNRPAGAGGREPGTADLRLENEISSSRVYVGQPVILTTRLLSSRLQIVDVSAGSDPTLPGFLLEESDTNVGAERVFREGREYQSYVLMRRILTPTSAGKTVVPPETRTIRVRAGARDMFESFFSPRVLEVVRTTAPVTVEALAPPAAGRPADFSGATGSFKMQASADRTEASVGDAVGVKVALTGTGSLKMLEQPLLAPSADFRVFDPRMEEKASGITPRTYTKTWNYVLTPLSPGDLTLPAFSFSYFDPESKSYRSLTSSPAPLVVKRTQPGAPSGPLPEISARREVQPLQKDIRFLKALDGPLQRRSAPLRTRWWVWAALSLSVLAQPAAWYIRLRGGAVALLPGGRRGRARRRALSEIARARAGSHDTVRTSTLAAGAVLGFLAERCAVPAYGLTYSEMGEELARRGVSAALCDELKALFELCDQGRFAPAEDRRGSAGELLARARGLVERLDSELGKAA